MLRRVVLVKTDVSEELRASFIRVTRIDELGTTLAVTSNRRTLPRNTTILHSHRRENLKSYVRMLFQGFHFACICVSHCLVGFGTCTIGRLML
jgi:hypothetical protein